MAAPIFRHLRFQNLLQRRSNHSSNERVVARQQRFARPTTTLIRLSEKVEKRKKKLSKRIYGTSHTVSEDEAKFVIEKGCKQLIFGTGHDAMASLSPEAAAFLNKRGCKVIAKPTPQAIRIFNKSKKAKVGLFHVTC